MPHELSWQDPLEFTKDYEGYDSLMLLHSSLAHADYGRHSILAVDEQEVIDANWKALEKQLGAQPDNLAAWNERWFGFIGYEAVNSQAVAASIVPLPSLRMARYRTVFVFDNFEKTLRRYGSAITPKPQLADERLPEIKTLASTMTKQEYVNIIKRTLEQIAGGEFYQANITRKFHGEFAEALPPLGLFARLCQASPGCYSALLKFDETAILSSSPECFLTIDATGQVESRPIKGTAPINVAPEALANSIKDRAENLMIVDLMRNDLSHHCIAGSVETHRLFEVTSYATLHHMASTVTGKRAAQASSLEIIRDCFPPGSMTGAPKKAVMQWCRQAEKIDRGVYSGALGWIAADGQADLSVVIRTLIIQAQRFEFQVGGGIVSDSEPEKEWKETLVKARGIANCLGIKEGKLAAL